MKPWTAPEIAIIRRVYPTHGAQACAAQLPGRDPASIDTVAWLHRIPAPQPEARTA